MTDRKSTQEVNPRLSAVNVEGGPPSSQPTEILRQFDRAAVVLTWGAVGLGSLGGVRALWMRLVEGGATSASLILGTLDGLLVAGLGCVAGGVAAPLLRALGGWLVARIDQPRTIVSVPEALSASELTLASAPSSDASARTAVERLRDQTVAEIRHAIRAGEWDDARDRLEALVVDDGEDPQLSKLRQELDSSRESARDATLAQLEAARSVNDPERVLELHRSVAPLLDPEARAELETDLSGWFLRTIHHRLRGGRILTDIALLAGRIADAMSHTPGGASLRASLPTLRRSAGLCPRCAGPYTGVADACPACLQQAQHSS